MDTVLQVNDVKCGGVATCQAALNTLSGYVDSSVDIPRKTALIRGDIDPQALAAVLAAAGYPASPRPR